MTIRTLAFLAAAVALAGCETSGPAGGPQASLMIAPFFAPGSIVAAPLPIDQVRIVIGRRGEDQPILDTTATFPPSATQLRLTLRVPLRAFVERLGVSIELRGQGVTYFVASDTVDVTAAGRGPPATPNLVLTYVGPGSQIRTLRIQPRDSVLAFGDSLRFRLTALDAQGQPVTSYPVDWKTTDPQVVLTDLGGIGAPIRRITVKVIARLPSGLADTVNLTFVPKPVAFSLTGGANQTGQPLTALATPLAVLVKAADSLPVAGVSVGFRAVLGGGSVRDAVVITGANGVASTIATLGGALGANQFEITVAGLPALLVNAIAAAGPASKLLYRSGGAQVAAAGSAFGQPLAVLVTDAGGFPVAGAQVSWSVIGGTGSVTSGTSTSNLLGVAAMGGNVGTVARITLIRANLTALPAAQFTFVVRATPGPPVSVVVTDGDGNPSNLDPVPLEVRVNDQFGNGVGGTNVGWTVISGFGSVNPIVTTDQRGLSPNGYLSGSSTQDTVQAAIPGSQAIFVLPPFAAAIMLRGAGQNQFAMVNQPLAGSLGLQLYDGNFGPLNGATINWQVVEGSGTLSAPTSLVDNTAVATILFTPGTTIGTTTIRATHLLSGRSTTFTLFVRPAPPATVMVAAGDNQSVPVGTNAPLPLEVVVLDPFGNPVPNVAVGWAATTRGGVSQATTFTNGFGIAGVTINVGTTVGPVQFTATVAGVPVVFFTATAR